VRNHGATAVLTRAVPGEEIQLKPRRITAIALAACAAFAGVAVAAETDTFRGHTEGSFFSHGEYRPAKISFKRTGNRLHDIRFEIRVRCPNGQHRSKVGRINEVRVHDGKFKLEQGVVGTPTSTTGEVDEFHASQAIKGRIRGDRASGIVSMSTELDSHGKESASGATCRSGKVEWTAAAL
jgi:hypothetical protein